MTTKHVNLRIILWLLGTYGLTCEFTRRSNILCAMPDWLLFCTSRYAQFIVTLVLAEFCTPFFETFGIPN